MVRIILAQISANVPEKESKENDLHKKNDCISLGALFSNRGSLSTIFAQISSKLPQFPFNCPKTTKLMHDFRKKIIIIVLGAIFVKSKHVQQFCEGLHIFCTNFLRFCPDFHQIKTFGGAVAPQSRRHGGLLGAYPLKQSYKPLKLKHETL